MTGTVVVLVWWQDESGFFACNDELRYSTGGPTYEHMVEHIEQSAQAEGWLGYRLAPLAAVEPDTP